MRISLRPDKLYQCYTDVTATSLQESGIRLLLCDLDYTLAPRSQKEPDEKVHRWIRALAAAGITVMILSNNRNSQRVETFCSNLGIGYVGRAGKPKPGGYRRAMRRMGIRPCETAVLGDKLLTDILGANLTGCRALMVEPLGGPVGAWNHVLHFLQRPVKAMRRER